MRRLLKWCGLGVLALAASCLDPNADYTQCVTRGWCAAPDGSVSDAGSTADGGPKPDGGGTADAGGTPDGGGIDGGPDAGPCSLRACSPSADQCCPSNLCFAIDPDCSTPPTLTTVSGTAGSVAFSDAPGIAARFHGLATLSVDPDGGRLYAGDDDQRGSTALNSLVRAIDPSGTPIIAGTLEGDGGASDGPRGSATIALVMGVFADSRQTPDIFFIDDFVLRAVTPTQVITVDAGAANDGGPTLPSILSAVTGIGPGPQNSELDVVSSAGLYVLVFQKDGSVVRIEQPSNNANTNLRNRSDTCSAAVGIPGSGVSHYLLCGDGVIELNASTGVVSAFANGTSFNTCATPNCCLDSDAGTPGFFQPQTFSLDPVSQDLYVADAVCGVRHISPSGYVSTLPPPPVPFWVPRPTGPYDVAVRHDASGVHVYELWADNVWDYDPVNGSFSLVAGPLGPAAGLSPLWVYSGADGGPAYGAAPAADPVKGFVATSTALYGVGNGHDLFQVDPSKGTSTRVFQYASGQNVKGVTLLDGGLYVSLSDDTIHRYDLGGGGDALFAGVPNQTGFQEGNVATAHLSPAAITTDGTDLYFVDDNLESIRHIDMTVSPPQLHTIIGGLDGGGVPVDGNASSAVFVNATGLAYAEGHLYTLDAQGAALRQIDVAKSSVATVGGTLALDGGAYGPPSSGLFAHAVDVASDGTMIYVADPGFGAGYHAVPDFNGPSLRVFGSFVDLQRVQAGQVGEWTTYDGTGNGAYFNHPSRLAVDPATRTLYFFDSEEGVFRSVH